MSGGHFDYVEYRLYETMELIQEEIRNGEWKEQMQEELRNGLDAVIRAHAYIRCLDYVISGDNSEDTISEDIQETIKKTEKDWVGGEI